MSRPIIWKKRVLSERWLNAPRLVAAEISLNTRRRVSREFAENSESIRYAGGNWFLRSFRTHEFGDVKRFRFANNCAEKWNRVIDVVFLPKFATVRYIGTYIADVVSTGNSSASSSSGGKFYLPRVLISRLFRLRKVSVTVCIYDGW